MNRIHSVALAALVALSFSPAANAEMMRAFWAGNVLDAVAGNAYELATGDKIFVAMNFDNNWLTSFASFDGQAVAVPANFYAEQQTTLTRHSWAPNFAGEIHFLDNLSWQAFENGQLMASGTWSPDDMKLAPRVIPVPAALPLLLGALGILGSLRRRS